MNVLAIVEHKVKKGQVGRTIRKLFPDWEWVTNYASSNKGRM